MFQTSDTTWQAYNTYGGNSLYGMYHINGFEGPRAVKVSYNRPLTTRGTLTHFSLWVGEIPVLRWLEANGYHVSYLSGVDTTFRGHLLTNGHKVFLSVGHDEYWSPEQRANVTAARDTGLHLAFLSGNEMFWKTRWEPSLDGSMTPYRTLVCYKETHDNAKSDPSAEWTGTWRDPRFTPPADGNQPESELTGTLFVVNAVATNSLEVPESFGKHRFWRNTSVAALAPGEKAVFPYGTLGFEWDIIPDHGRRPAGQMRLSWTEAGNLSVLQNYGSTYAPGNATHSLSLYRHASGALVFGAGTVQLGWALDDFHANSVGPSADQRVQQAMVNLLADMGVQPGSLQPGLVQSPAGTDAIPPVSNILAPTNGAVLSLATPVSITGTASDAGGGRAWAVEVSTDGGTTWQEAAGQTNWSFTWTPRSPGQYRLRSRAVDDHGNLEMTGSDLVVTVSDSGFSAGVVGDSSEGLVPDGIYGDGAYINANRFQCDSNVLVAWVRAKVEAVAGTYRCAIYSDVGGRPGRLLGFTAPRTAPETGWRSFPLARPLALAGGTVIWLAVWSDDPAAGVYATAGSRELRWGRYNVGAWPDPLVTLSSGNINYSIYAVGLPLAVRTFAVDDEGWRLGFDSVPGETYAVEAASTLSGPWTTVVSNLPAATFVTTVTNLPTGGTHRYYRVKLWP